MVYTTCLKSPEAMDNVKLICFGSRINYLNQPINANARSAFASFSFSDRLTRSIAGMFPHLRRILRYCYSFNRGERRTRQDLSTNFLPYLSRILPLGLIR